MRPILPAAIALGLSAAAARAADPPKPVQPYVDLQTIGFPAVVNGRLVNYLFTQVRLNIAPGADGAKLQQEEPFLRDALVRASGRQPFNRPGDGMHLDDARLRAETMRQAVARFGSGKVLSVKIRSEIPQRRTGVPGSATPFTGVAEPR